MGKLLQFGKVNKVNENINEIHKNFNTPPARILLLVGQSRLVWPKDRSSMEQSREV